MVMGMSFGGQVSLAFGVSVTLIALGYLMKTLLSDSTLPADWVANALRAGAAPDPVSLSGIITTAGIFFGICVGAAWMKEYQASGPFQKRALRYVVGLIGVLVFWLLLGQILPRDESFFSFILRFFRYTLVGGWVTGGAPWLFQKINLAEKTAAG
jgi:uncharacterized YccA/Bax inhibitor family protein